MDLSGEPGAAPNSYAFTVMKNGAITGITCTVAGPGPVSCNDTTNSVEFAAGDLIALRSIPTSNPTARTLRWSLTLTQ